MSNSISATSIYLLVTIQKHQGKNLKMWESSLVTVEVQSM